MQAIDIRGVHDSPACKRTYVGVPGTGLWVVCDPCGVAMQADTLHNIDQARSVLSRDIDTVAKLAGLRAKS